MLDLYLLDLQPKLFKLFTILDPGIHVSPLSLHRTLFYSIIPFVFIVYTSNLWVPSIKCTDFTKSPACKVHKRYDSTKSSTYADDSKDGGFTLPYGSGTVVGFLSKDNISVGSIPLAGTVFGEVTQEPGDAFTQGNFDGILGLGFPGLDITKGKSPPIFDLLMKAKALPKNQFAFSLDSTPGGNNSQI